MKKAYSRKGDQGITQTCIGNPLSKDDSRIIAIGKIDSLQAAIDASSLNLLCNSIEKSKNLRNKETNKLLLKIQKKLWQLGGELAGAAQTQLVDPITKKDLKDMEQWIDSLGKPPNQFIRFNTAKSIRYNECRVRCRELETYLVPLLKNKQIRSVAYQYINRLSSLFFMLAYKETRK